MYQHLPKETVKHYLGNWKPPPRTRKAAKSSRNSKAGRRRERRADELQADHAATQKQFEAEAALIKEKMISGNGIPDV